MKIKFFCPRWGFEKIPWEIFLANVKEAGYAGIEWFPYGEKTNHQEAMDLLQQLQLEFCIVMTVVKHHDRFEDYVNDLRNQLLDLSSMHSGKTKPLHISA